MSTILIFLAAVLACASIAVWVFRRRVHRRYRLPFLNAFAGANTRKLSPEERSTVEQYLDTLNRSRLSPGPTGASAAPVSLNLNAQSDTVLCVTRSITRYGITTDDPNKWRYYLDSVEVHLPPFWEQYINDENSVELIHTDTLPLVISLNGHTLSEYVQEAPRFALERASGTQASIRGEETEQIELLNIRQETHEEYVLSRPDGIREAVLIVASFLLFFICLLTPDVFVPWLAGGAVLLLAAGLWGIFAPPAKTSLREIHCLRGTPKRWGLFGENDQEHINNISLGIIDLIYPRHWQPWIAQDLGHKTDIDIYLDRHVVRQGRYLSLHDEVKNFPLQHWLRSAVIAGGAALIFIMLLLFVPLDMPIKFTLSWIKGAQTVEATSVQQLEEAGVRVGDTLRLKGTGMCNIHTPGAWNTRQNSPFAPFDCSQIIWNDASPLPLPESDVVNKATALTQTINRQLHPKPDDDSRVSPALRSAIQKSGMVLLDDFNTVQQIINESPEFAAVLKKRGITDPKKVITTPLTVGFFDGKDGLKQEDRLLKVISYLDVGDGNYWAHPIENLVAVVDLEQKKIQKIEEGPVVPVPLTPRPYDGRDRVETVKKPLEIIEPEGKNYTITGDRVHWQNWDFHLSLDSRVGPIISTVTYNDNGKKRQVMYQGSLGGMIVPYGDPDIGW